MRSGTLRALRAAPPGRRTDPTSRPDRRGSSDRAVGVEREDELALRWWLILVPPGVGQRGQHDQVHLDHLHLAAIRELAEEELDEVPLEPRGRPRPDDLLEVLVELLHAHPLA